MSVMKYKHIQSYMTNFNKVSALIKYVFLPRDDKISFLMRQMVEISVHIRSAKLNACISIP